MTMEMQCQDSAEEIKRLQRCNNDLISLLTLPALCGGGDSSQIARTLIDVLQRMLGLDLIYVVLKDPMGDVATEHAGLNHLAVQPPGPQAIGRELSSLLGADPQTWTSQTRRRVAGRDLSLLPIRLGLAGEFGIVVAGVARADFPLQTEELLLRMATNQAAIALREARLLGEQKRIAEVLDQLVAQRTKELAAANQELRLQVGLLQLIPVAAWTILPDGTTDFINQKWIDYTGQDLDYVLSVPQAWMSVTHPDDREVASHAFWKGIRGGRDFTMETRFLRVQDGTYRWHLNRAVALHDAEGNVVKFVGTSTDIDDLKHSQEELDKTEQRARLIVDTASDAIVTMDATGVITSWNKQAEVIFGWISTEAVGRRMSELVGPPLIRTTYERGLQNLLGNGEVSLLQRRIEGTGIRRSGAEFPIELEVRPMKLGKELIFSAFIRDITDSKLAEEKLRRSELSLRQLTETIPEMLWSAAPDGSIDYCNSRLLNYTGIAAQEIMADGWLRFVHPDDVHETVQAWISSVSSGAPYQIEVRIIHAPDNSYRWCVVNALPLLDVGNRILKWHGTVVDMHNWRLAQEALRHTQAELANMTRITTMGQLTASIAHEVNQPLSGIIVNAGTCLRMLDARPPDLDGARETARRTIRDGNRAAEVVSRLRALFSKRRGVMEAVDLNEAAREVIALLWNQFQKSLVTLQSELDEDLPLIAGDRVQIQQVIMNLLQNACDSMTAVGDRPRQLVIHTHRDDADHVRLTVQDNGIGLDPDSVNRVFDAFFTTKSSGMGIGLSVSRSIIENHHGRIWAVPNDGPGATFSFSIPRGADTESETDHEREIAQRRKD